MGVSCTYSPSFGVKITVGLPRDVGREAGFEICDEIDALIRARLGGGRAADRKGDVAPKEVCPPAEPPGEESVAVASEPVTLEYVPFPKEGTVTMKEITAAWRISQATYYRHMDIYPKPLKLEGLAKNAPSRFDAAKVAHAFKCGHVERRRREVRS